MLAQTVIGALRRFLPDFLSETPSLSLSQRRACWAITHCRTEAMGGRRYACEECGKEHFAYHSCNHKACPQCGSGATEEWVQRQLSKQIHAPYFMVTFTVPQELRECFFGRSAKDAFETLFSAASGALQEKLANAKGFPAVISGFTAVLHTWNQRLEFHPHLHVLVPGAGMDANGKVITVKKPEFLLHLPLLQAAFRQHFRKRLEALEWKVNPLAWTKNWGVHIQPCGSGTATIKYLGAYVARTAIGDGRIVAVTEKSVTFRWKDRSEGGQIKELTLDGVEFVRRYLRHVLPRGMRSIRYYGFCHPSAKKNRERIRMHTGTPVELGAEATRVETVTKAPECSECKKPMKFVERIRRQFVPQLRIGSAARAPPRQKLVLVVKAAEVHA